MLTTRRVGGGRRFARPAWVAPVLSLILVLGARKVLAENVEFLPELSVQLTASRYAPSEDAFVWDGWVGAGAGLLRVDNTTLYFTADVETIIGRERRMFDANQANYHLEAGAKVHLGRYGLTPFIHHVSRHLIDRPKTQPVDWNLVGVRTDGPLPHAFGVPGRYGASIGHTVDWSYVGYQWEFTATVVGDLWSRPWGSGYLLAHARAVTVKDQPPPPRGDFVDFLGEGGLRFSRGDRALALFVAYEHRNDVRLLAPGSKDRALFGFHINLGSGGNEGSNLPPSWPSPPR